MICGKPLQLIISAQELLARRLTTSPEREHLERSERASTQLAEQLDQLVDALQLHRSTGRILLVPVALQPILGHLAQQIDGPARRKGVRLRLSPTPAVVTSHGALLDSVLRNLMRNALDHTLPGGRVLVCCRRRGAAFRIEVRDSGEGIPPDKVSTVFEPFFRLDAAHSDGLGLGLFIVKRAAECLGHRIEVRSAPHRGSCFAVIAQAAHDPLTETSWRGSAVASRKLDKAEWQAFCNDLSKALPVDDLRTVTASLAVDGEVAVEWVALLGVAYDPRRDNFEIALGGLEHRIRKPETVYVDEGPSGIAALEVIDASGLRHGLRLNRPLKPAVRRRLSGKRGGAALEHGRH